MQREIEIESSHGTIYVFPDGTITRYGSPEAKKEFGDLVGVRRFDLPTNAISDGFADVLECGVWTNAGYDPPVYTY